MHPALGKPYEQLTPANCVLVLIDHQMGLLLTTQSINLELLRRNTLGLAKVAKLFGIPVVLTSGGSHAPGRGFNGPLFPELRELLPDAPLIERTALNAWHDPRVVAAVRATGRTKVLMGGISSDICLAYATVSAAGDGYEVYFVADVSSTWDARAELTAMLRMAQRGVVMTNWVSVAAELQADWERNAATAPDFFRILGENNAAFQGVGAAITANGGRLY